MVVASAVSLLLSTMDLLTKGGASSLQSSLHSVGTPKFACYREGCRRCSRCEMESTNAQSAETSIMCPVQAAPRSMLLEEVRILAYHPYPYFSCYDVLVSPSVYRRSVHALTCSSSTAFCRSLLPVSKCVDMFWPLFHHDLCAAPRHTDSCFVRRYCSRAAGAFFGSSCQRRV